jgi:hypothetical protein
VIWHVFIRYADGTLGGWWPVEGPANSFPSEQAAKDALPRLAAQLDRALSELIILAVSDKWKGGAP